MTIPFKGYKYGNSVCQNPVRIDNGVDIVSTPSISGLGSVELNKDRVNNFSGGIRFQKISNITNITIKIKWITDDWSGYDFLYVRVYDDANNKIFEKSFTNPPACGVLTEFDWITDTFYVGVSEGYVEFYLTTDDYNPSKCFIDLSSALTDVYEYNAEPTATKGETLDSRIEKYRFSQTVASYLDEVEVSSGYSYLGTGYGFVNWSDGLTNRRRSIANLSYLEAMYSILTSWRTLYNNFKHTGYKSEFYSTIFFGGEDYYFYALNKDGSLKWSYFGTDVFNGPVVSPDGTIYVGCNDSNLYAFNPDGTIKWKYFLSSYGWLSFTPTIADDGTIYFNSDDGNLYALNPDGTLKWTFYHGSVTYSTPSLGSDGTIYFGASNKYLYALNPDGTLKWKYYDYWKVGDRSPAIADDGTIYLGSDWGYLTAFNPNGTIKWSITVSQHPSMNFAIGSDGTIYVGSGGGLFYAINPNGTVKWTYRYNPNLVESYSPAIAPDGTIYFGTDDYYLYALNPNGTLKWRFQAGNSVRNTIAIGSDGTIYFGSLDTYFYALNPDGTLKWKFKTGGWVESSPALS